MQVHDIKSSSSKDGKSNFNALKSPTKDLINPQKNSGFDEKEPNGTNEKDGTSKEDKMVVVIWVELDVIEKDIGKIVNQTI